MTPVDTSSSAALLVNALLANPHEGELEWEKWRAQADLAGLDYECYVTIPMLSSRLTEWLSHNSSVHSLADDQDRKKILGICKRAWAGNQFRFRELSDVWTMLHRKGVAPIALGGCAAWASLYWEERSVRPISAVDILIPCEQAMCAQEVLWAAGWPLDTDVPLHESRLLDQFERITFRAPSQFSFSLKWKLPEIASASQTNLAAVSSVNETRLLNTRIDVVSTEELLLNALTRPPESLVSWKCDAIVLLRNRNVDWPRFIDISCSARLAPGRLEQLRKHCGASIPQF